MKKPLLMIFMLITLSNYSFAVSYNCKKANNKTEKIICANKKLSHLDDVLNADFRAVYAFIADPAGFRQEQNKWIKKRNHCLDTPCIIKEYKLRIAKLNRIKNKPKPCFQLLERNWPEVQSGHYPVCIDFVNNLNQFCSEPPPTCERKIDPKYKILKLLDWEKLDPKKHLNVIGQMLTSNYFFRKKWRPLSEKMKAKILKGETKLSHAWVDIDYDGTKENVVRFDAGQCHAINPTGEKGFYGFNYQISVADKLITKIDKRFEYLHRTTFDVLLHDKRSYLLSRQSASNNEFSLREGYSVKVTDSRNAKSICVFRYQK